MLCCYFSSYHSIFTRSRLHLNKPLSLLIHKKQPLTFEVLSGDYSNLVPSSGSTSSSFAVSTTSVRPSSAEILNPFKVIREHWNQLLPNSCWYWYFDSSHELWMFLMTSRVVNLFQKIFNLLCPDPSEELLSAAAVILRSVFLK